MNIMTSEQIKEYESLLSADKHRKAKQKEYLATYLATPKGKAYQLKRLRRSQAWLSGKLERIVGEIEKLEAGIGE
jgi:hypothetical protein